MICAAVPAHLEVIDHGGALPRLPEMRIGMYLGDGPNRPLIERLAEAVRDAFGAQTAAVAAE